MRLDYKLAEAAQKDLREISAYTLKTWGKEQAKAYREIIRASLKLISETPEIGQKRSELMVGLRSFPVGHHIAYYVEREDGIVVARILHPAMDQEQAMQK